MRKHILTDTEKRAIRKFLEDGKTSIEVRMVRYRARKLLPVLKEEIELLERFLKNS